MSSTPPEPMIEDYPSSSSSKADSALAEPPRSRDDAMSTPAKSVDAAPSINFRDVLSEGSAITGIRGLYLTGIGWDHLMAATVVPDPHAAGVPFTEREHNVANIVGTNLGDVVLTWVDSAWGSVASSQETMNVGFEILKVPDTMDGHDKQVANASFSARNPLLFATGSFDGRIAVWSLEEGAGRGMQFSKGIHTDYVRDVAWSPNHPNTVFTASDDRMVYQYDVESRQVAWKGEGHEAFVKCLVLPEVKLGPSSSFGDVFYSCGDDRTIRGWDIRQPGEIFQFVTGDEYVLSMDTLDDHSFVFSDGAGRVGVVDYRFGGAMVKKTRVDTDWIRTLQTSPDLSKVGLASDEGRVVVIDASSLQLGDDTYKLLVDVQSHDGGAYICRAHWSPTGSELIVASRDRDGKQGLVAYHGIAGVGRSVKSASKS